MAKLLHHGQPVPEVMDKHSANKQRLAVLRAAMVDFSAAPVRTQLRDLSTADTVFRIGHPIGETNGPDNFIDQAYICLLYTSPSPRDATLSRMPSSA